MKSSNIKYLIVFVLVFLADQVSKLWGEGLPSLYYNAGFIMGHFSGQPKSIRIVALGSFAAILFAVYVLLLSMIPGRGRILKYALSGLMGGLFGNVVDKLAIGSTRDFIPFSVGQFYWVFNVADVFIWISAFIILWVVVRKDHLLWHENNTRRFALINPPEQIGFAIQLTSIVFSSCLVLSVFSFALIRTTSSGELIKPLPVAFALTSLSLFLCFYAFLAGMLLGHRRLGPLYAFELFVNDLLAGKSRPLKLREGDNYKHLEKTAEKLRYFVDEKVHNKNK